MNHGIAHPARDQPEQMDTASADEQAQTSKNLDRSLVHGIAWTGGMRFLAQGLRWGSTLLLARLLSPLDYGLVGYATVYLGLISLINELGLSAAIVQQRHLTREQIAKIGGVSAILGVTLFLVSIAGAPLVASFFREARVQPIVAVLAGTFVLKGFQVLPRALMTRELAFRRMAWIDGIEAFVLAGSTLLLAFLGHGYWSLVIGSIIGTAVGTLLAWWFRPHPMSWPSDFASIRDSITYGAHVAASRVTWYLYSHADFAVVGRMLGTVALGAYTFGWSIANIPVEKVSATLSRVTSGVFASAQHDDAAIRRYLLSITEGLAMVTFPIAAGLALVSREFVLVLLGDQWEPAILPMALLVAYSGFRSISLLFGQVLVATGRARRNMHFGVIALIVLPVLFMLGARWGTAGVALAWIVGYPAVFVPFAMKYTLNEIGLSWSAYGRALWPALSSTAVMMAAVLGSRLLLPGGDDTRSMALRLVVMVAVGVVTYSAVGLGAHGARLRAFRSVLAMARK
jgi:PST family polysaccharide transporter